MFDTEVTPADLAELGLDVASSATAEQTNTDTTSTETATAQPAETNASAEQNPQTPAPETRTANDKSSHAFAQLRNENKALNQLFNDLAKAYNISGKDSSEVMKGLKDHLLTKQAETQNIPKEVLERLALLEARDAEYTKFTRAQKAEKDFAKLREEFSLSDEQVLTFVNQTAADGLNPFEQDGIDLRTEYIKRNYAALIKAAEERGARAEAERASKVTTNSTSPMSKIGQTTGAQQQRIDTISNLDAFLAQLDKK